jgi:hypothetical protein
VFVDEVLETHPVDEEAAARWNAFVAGESLGSQRGAPAIES